ncbi:MAG TPA: threonine synthase [Anaerolineaceae bacterium]|nr:threonine synthase [Anaerolineaceae bacterium]
MKEPSQNTLTHLECPECGHFYPADELQTFCLACQSPLLARYDLSALRSRAGLREEIARRPRGLWRWAELLPVREAGCRVSLGEGDTPLLYAGRLGVGLGVPNLWIKEEALNPTGSFKARGLAVAVSRAAELGARVFVIPTAGNAGGALAAYTARAGLEAHVFMPQDAPRLNQVEVEMAGAHLYPVAGLIHDAARAARSAAAGRDWFDVSTFKEPYRVEGKKTMGLELAEAFDWQLPDVMIYPTGGGTGLVGMWKAFGELEELGWIDRKRPRMVSVQATGCAPVVRAVEQGLERTEPWENAKTIAAGLRVPTVFADRLVLRAIRESRGTALAVSDAEILTAQRELAREEGILVAPEGAATLAALHALCARNWIQAGERVVLFNTGSGLKYL